METPRVQLATSLLFVGAVWQMLSASTSSIDSMSSFLGAHNQIQKDEQERIYRDVHPWRILRRRRLVKVSRLSVGSLLTPNEERISRQYEREAIGWSIVIIGTIVLSISGWVDWFAK